MNYQTYNNYYYHKSKAVWWLHRRVDNEYIKKTKKIHFNDGINKDSDARDYYTFKNGKRTYASKLIQRITEDLK